MLESAPGAARDRISDFAPHVDRIDLAAVDANLRASGNQAFHWVDTDQFGAAGELRFGWSGCDTIVSGNTDNDAAAEFQIVLSGRIGLISQDFVL